MFGPSLQYGVNRNGREHIEKTRECKETKHLVLARWKQRPALPSHAEIRMIETSRKLCGALSKAIRPSFLSKTHQAHMPAHESIGQVNVV
jgi:hypothetical protein